MSVNLNYGIYLLRHLICLVNWDQVYHVVPICVRKIKIFVHTFDFPPLKSNSFQLWFTYNSMKEPVTVLSWVIICTLSGSHWSQSNFIPKGHWSSFWGDTQYGISVLLKSLMRLHFHSSVTVLLYFMYLHCFNVFMEKTLLLPASVHWQIQQFDRFAQLLLYSLQNVIRPYWKQKYLHVLNSDCWSVMNFETVTGFPTKFYKNGTNITVASKCVSVLCSCIRSVAFFVVN